MALLVQHTTHNSHHCSGTSVGPQAPPNTKCCSSTAGRALAACPRHVVSICGAALPILALQLNNYCPSCTRKRRCRRRRRPNKPPPARGVGAAHDRNKPPTLFAAPCTPEAASDCQRQSCMVHVQVVYVKSKIWESVVCKNKCLLYFNHLTSGVTN